ncbi:PEP-CTERM sorting domain-containing protein [Nostoc sp. ChiQUE01b]|uniref:PEP-CTERM sorting domain-containing protein n=1 Tax=Nostoc sp. ChiQUE01b TaxID=3075376 RepID=UPI002AD52DFA|nr:PEP-CTERM sorting domain-containing protein [Nostoc sp. ChiQUE01b]MDZ8259209.1 PEP-CTERM sorting domain-containing protein [Nostoc sp. ChiQUE01b]
MTKNNRKKAVAQAIFTAIALGWVIMQVELAQAATLTVNNLDDSGFGSLRDAINTATSNDVVEFLLGSNPSTITLTTGALAIAKNLTINGPGANLLTISGNNQFPVFDINAANVRLSGLAIAGNFNAYNSSNITFTNSSISGDNVNIDSNLKLINSTISSKRLVINGELTGIDDSNVTALDSITIGGNLTASSGNLTISTDKLYIKGGSKNSGAAGSLTITTNALTVSPGAIISKSVPEPSAIASGSKNLGAAGTLTITTNAFTVSPDAIIILKSVPESSAIAAGSNHSGLRGNITITTSNLIVRRVPEPSAIADDSNNSGVGGSITISAPNGFIISKPVPEPSAIIGTILAGSLAWLAKRKQAAFRKAKI